MSIRKKKSPDRSPTCRRSENRAAIRSPFCTLRGKKVAGRVLQAIFGLLLIILFPPQTLAVEMADDPIRPFIQNGGYAVKTAQGRIEGLNSDTPFIPASTIKLVTSLAALDILGPEYRFQTHFYVDPAGNLIIKGEGDPTLTSEDVAVIAKDLLDHGLRRIKALVLDGSTFALETTVDGSENSANPYDAEITPLAVNFNALPLRVHKDGTIDSGEEQTPVLPMMQEIGKSLGPGRYRLNVAAFPVRDNLPNEARYAGELFRALLRVQGIRTGGLEWRIAGVPPVSSRWSRRTGSTCAWRWRRWINSAPLYPR